MPTISVLAVIGVEREISTPGEWDPQPWHTEGPTEIMSLHYRLIPASWARALAQGANTPTMTISPRAKDHITTS